MKPIAWTALLAWLLVAAVPATAQDAVALQRALDKAVDVSIEAMPIAQVFQKLQAQTGAKFVLPEETLALLPYGDQTRLKVELKNVTLRKALPPMLAQQALTWTVDNDVVRICPKEALYRLGRRATYDELRALGILYSETLQPADKGGPALDQLRKLAGNPKLTFVFPASVDADALLKQGEPARSLVASEWLDFLCQGKALTWFLRGDEIVVLEMRTQVERQLQKIVTLKYENAQLANVLVDLVRQARVKLSMDPGVMNYLPRETRDNFNLVMSDATVAQAFEVISGATGLRFHATNEGVLVDASEGLVRKSQPTSAPARVRRPFFVRMNMPGPGGTNIEVYISPDELPDDVVDAIQAEKIKMIDKMRQSIPTRPAATTAPAPASRPATSAEGGVG